MRTSGLGQRQDGATCDLLARVLAEGLPPVSDLPQRCASDGLSTNSTDNCGSDAARRELPAGRVCRVDAGCGLLCRARSFYAMEGCAIPAHRARRRGAVHGTGMNELPVETRCPPRHSSWERTCAAVLLAEGGRCLSRLSHAGLQLPDCLRYTADVRYRNLEIRQEDTFLRKVHPPMTPHPGQCEKDFRLGD